MESCPDCFQRCLLCTEVLPTPDCPSCELLQADHNLQYHAKSLWKLDADNFALSARNAITARDARQGLIPASETSSGIFERTSSVPAVSNPPASRRREWTDDENRDFERWITGNPKPTKQQKLDFASRHKLLTLSQVQNKINNWRSGRNIQRKQIPPAVARAGEKPGQSEEIAPPQEVASAAELYTPDWSSEIFGIPIPSISHVNVLSGQGKASEPDAIAVSADIPSDMFEALSVEDDEPGPRFGSPVSSIVRYIESSELEADRRDIEMTLQTASEEDIRAEWQPQECMRLPSLKHQALQYHSTESIILRDPLEPEPIVIEPEQICDDCKVNKEQCDGALPCSQCDKANRPCSNCIPFGVISAAHRDRSLRPSSWEATIRNLWCTRSPPKRTLSLDLPCWLTEEPNVPTKSPPVSSAPVRAAQAPRRARSVKSAHSSSHSIGSTHSARYSVKLQRRISANNRRHSAAEVRTDAQVARSASITSLKTKPASQKPNTPTRICDGRAEYWSCTFPECYCSFSTHSELIRHARHWHWIKYCTFCGQSFANPESWHNHERAHIGRRCTEIDNILWKCAICLEFGLGEPRRAIHIRRHWTDGAAGNQWKGGPQIMPLKPEDMEALHRMSSGLFKTTAEHLLSEYVRAFPPPGRAPDAVDLSDQRIEAAQRSAAIPNLKEKTAATSPIDAAVETPKPMIHGLFASLRRRLPLFRYRPP